MRILLMVSIIFSFYAHALQPAPYVNMQKFSGLWYEMARTYNSFQHSCVGSSVEYILEDKEYDIKNRCFKEKIGAELIEYNGTGESVSEDDNIARIDMTYFWIFTKEYRIVYINESYTSAIVVDEELDSVWIMHRKPIISREELQTLVDFLSPHIDISQLIYTPQDPQGRFK